MEGRRRAGKTLVALVFGLLLVICCGARPVPESGGGGGGDLDPGIGTRVWSYTTIMETRDAFVLRSGGGGGNPAPQGNTYSRGREANLPKAN
ncbi:hypothetical protein H6P81_017447 [Aristolochia fimbriata]|uniref:Uncharacterized protein n=1 Tax=Aristolochia fimbriata TaxID=158543 RepID=A0AAV7DYI4_ARIFI|nr:hypothetical protein H6P81_017447 [Aristolochia fimbriata]